MWLKLKFKLELRKLGAKLLNFIASSTKSKSNYRLRHSLAWAIA
jgi:hypothetical protein